MRSSRTHQGDPVGHDDVDQYAAAVHRRDAARLVRLIVVLAVVAVLVLLGLDNRQDVQVGYLVDETTAPLWMVIVISALGGVLIGALLRVRSRQHRV